MKQAFVSIVSSYVGYCVASVLRNHHGYDVVGSIRAEDTEDITTLVSKTVDADDETGTAQLALLSDVVVLCLLEDVRGADAVLSALQMPQETKFGGPSHVLVLSTTMTWAKTEKTANLSPAKTGTAGSSEMPTRSSSRLLLRPVSMMAVDRRSGQGSGAGTGGLPRVSSAISHSSPSRDGSRLLGTASSKNSGRAINNSHATGLSRRRHQPTPEPAMTEADYLLRQPPTGYLEHKRLEVAALHLQSSTLNTCVIGAGVPYGLGEGTLLLQVFREAWRARGSPVVLPTCTAGDNYLALIHVVDLSVVVGNLLRPVGPDASPGPFPKPYILAVEGNGAQCTVKEMTAAIGRGFGGCGKTQPMGEAELEDFLVEDPGALSLLIDIRFSNDGGVLAEMVADGTLDPVTWSRGFAASAKSVAKEFVSSRSLQPIKAVVLGLPGGKQGHVCHQISQRYGILHVDAKLAVDGVFEALGKPLPPPAAPEEKAPPVAKGKRAKDTKKGTAKAEQPPEAQAALATLPPTESLLADIQGAFEAAGVPMSDYLSLDAGGLTRLLSPSIVARAARLLLEEKITQWACSGYILCDIPSHGDVAHEIFGDQAPSSPTDAAGVARAGAGGGSGSPKATGGGGKKCGGSGSPVPVVAPTDADQSDKVFGEFHPTHVVYLAASLEYIVEQQGREADTATATGTNTGTGTGVGIGERKDAEAKLRGDLERYFAQEQQTEAVQTAEHAFVSAEISTASPPGEQHRKGNNGSSNENNNVGEAGGVRARAREGDNGDSSNRDEERWIPATAKSLQHRYFVKAKTVDVQGVDRDGGILGVVQVVQEHLCGQEIPAFVWMLAGGGVGVDVGVDVAGEEGKGPAEEKHNNKRTGGGKRSAVGDGEGEAADGNLDTTWTTEPGAGKDNDNNDNSAGSANGLSLSEVLAKLTARDAKEVETRTRRHRKFLTDGVVPQVAAGLVAAAEAEPENVFDFLADYLISAGQALQREAEEEAALKYQTGLTLLQEMEANDNKRATAAYR